MTGVDHHDHEVGHRVMVFEGDIERARALLAQEGLTEKDLA
jgi:hypothetical protein